MSEDKRVRLPATLYEEAQDAINDGRLSSYRSVAEFVRDRVRDGIPEEGS